jgi:hypothetical protein
VTVPPCMQMRLHNRGISVLGARSSSLRLGPREFRPRVVGGDAAGGVDEGGARGLATQLEIVEDGA